MPKSKGKKFYAVAKGRKVGIFQTWDECKTQVHGFQGSRYKGFKTQSEAMEFIKQFQGSAASVSSSISSNVVPEGDRKRKGREDSGADNRKKVRDEASGTTNTSDSNVTSGPIHVRGGATIGLTFHIQFDGGARGNPGVAGAGTQIVLSRSAIVKSSSANQSSKAASATKRIQQSQSKTVVKRVCKTLVRHYLGDYFTNNEAEYQGLICGLQNVLETLQSQKYQLAIGESVALIVQGDSKLIINQLKGSFECKSPKLKPYFRSARSLLQQIKEDCLQQTDKYCQVTLEHVYRESNKVADSLANNAMDARRSWTTKYEEDDEDEANTDNEEGPNDDETSAPADAKWV
mmetsp:Transcript_46418/g.112519  ORF Transcript_46418/g.112519 Transcript_46418/m.112519 type:complete len:346 (-) Transcript_46418:1753-2790(-)